MTARTAVITAIGDLVRTPVAATDLKLSRRSRKVHMPTVQQRVPQEPPRCAVATQATDAIWIAIMMV